ncbi:MAG: hypothetical protein INF12_14740 [Methylobacterium sp.]|nr:hypothetical protein [Methylobacterium sp.]
MTRKRPRNRLECETHKIKAREDTGATFYVQLDREREGLKLGPVVGVRIYYKNAKGSDLDTALLKISDLISREVQTLGKDLTP